jgi:hypothetical protein
MQKHYSLYVQKEKEENHSHTEELKHYHMQLQEYPHPSDIFGIHHGVYKDIDWTLEIFFFHFFGFVVHMLNKIANKASYAQL